MNKLIVFSKDKEIIVTTSAKRKDTIKEYFTLGGRDLDEYEEQEVSESAVYITSTLRVKSN